jgi:murein DD-endopeptidase MepM/ murein hydrolase activator NlpD
MLMPQSQSRARRAPQAARRRRPARAPLALERLEDRTLPATFVVSVTDDSGPGSLRDAITQSNATPIGTNVIDFNIGTGVQTISLLSALPAVTRQVTIDGTSQPGFAGTPLIVLDGTSAGANVNGLTVSAGDSDVRGLVIDNFSGNGIALQGGVDGIVGNYIGVDSTGAAAAGNGGDGIAITSGDNIVGGITAAARNVISANGGDGVEVFGSASRNVVEGNFIGTDVTGTAGTDGGGNPLGNGNDGVAVHDSVNTPFNNTVGGMAAGAGNVISANGGDGVEVFHAVGSAVQGNFIGTDVTGTAALGNGTDGVALSNGAGGTLIGGTAAGARNVISSNAADGVEITGFGLSNNLVEGNFIGTDVSGTAALGNGADGVAVHDGASGNFIGNFSAGGGNVISGNAADGVDVFGSGAHANEVLRNFIGTDVTGTAALGNGADGVAVHDGASDNFIGNTAAGDGNVISANTANGVDIFGSGATVNQVESNFIGTDVTGTAALGNGGNGVLITTASGNSIGGTASGAGNVIAFSGNDGVKVDTGTGDAVRQNSIHDSTNLGIELVNNGNNSQPAPVLSSAISNGSSVTIQGTLTAAPNTSYALDFFANPTPNASGAGEGQQLLGSVTRTTDGSGTVSFTVTLTAAVAAGEAVSATATDPAGDTSAFAQDVSAGLLALTNAHLVDAHDQPVSAPDKGEEVFVEADWTTQGLPGNASYRISYTVDSVTLFSRTLTLGAGSGTVDHWAWYVGGWFAAPGAHTVSVTLDPAAYATDTRTFGFAPVSAPDLPAKFLTPLGGTPFQTWGVVNYVDVDPRGGTFADYQGGPYTYDGHTGHDLTLSNFGSMDAGVPDYAAAAGTVVEVQDGYFDRNRSFSTAPANYVVVDHGNGWQTLYYHLRTDTILVHVGDHVVAGQVLGLAGSSGDSTLAHLHFQVEHNGDLVEPEYDPATYWLNPLPYQGSLSSVLDSGVTSSQATATADLNQEERPVSANVFTQAAGQQITAWFQPFTRNGDSAAFRFFRPDGSEDTALGFSFTAVLARGGYYYMYRALPSNLPLGTWHVGIYLNGTQMASDPFQVTAAGAGAAHVAQGGTYVPNGRTTPVDFGTVSPGSTPPQLTFTVANLGSAALTLSNLVLPTGFALVGSFPAGVAVGSAATFTVQMGTAVSATNAGTLSFSTNDPGAPTYSFNLKGVVSGGNPGAVHGQVFRDANGDGVENGTEAGLAGWAVSLLDPGTGNVLATALTGYNGYYAFLNLAAGSYRVREAVPAGWRQTTATPPDVTVGAADVLVSPFGVVNTPAGPGAAWGGPGGAATPAPAAPGQAPVGSAPKALPGLPPPAGGAALPLPAAPLLARGGGPAAAAPPALPGTPSVGTAALAAASSPAAGVTGALDQFLASAGDDLSAALAGANSSAAPQGDWPDPLAQPGANGAL